MPGWALRLRREREARGLSQAAIVDRMLAHGDHQLPSAESLQRRYRAWEHGENVPETRYQELIARTFGTVRAAIWPPDLGRRSPVTVPSEDDGDTLDIITRIRASDVDDVTLERIGITVDRLCTAYPSEPADQLLAESRRWLVRVAELRSARLTLRQHREVLTLAGWLALLVGCLQYDTRQPDQAEMTRRAALSLGAEAGHAEIQGWAHEMRAWFALTSGDYRGVVVAARTGVDAASQHGVAVQLEAQTAKAWARMGDRREVELALDRGRNLLERLPYPQNVAHHFVVDPAKYDYYGMDAYRVLGEDHQARNLAEEVIRSATNIDGSERSPMRCSEARITLGVAAARSGDLEQAVNLGTEALGEERKSIPHLLMTSRELAHVLTTSYRSETATREYLDRLRELSG